MSPVVEIPQHLLFALMAAIGSQPAGNAESMEAVRAGALQRAVIAQPATQNAYQFAPEPFFDALAGLRDDPRFARYARRIFKTSSGEAYVPVAREAKAILALRNDPVIARHVAEHYARANTLELARALGRPVGLADVGLAHTVGLRFAREILEAAVHAPGTVTALALPDLDDIAPGLVFAGDRATTFRDVVGAIDKGVSRAWRKAGFAHALPTAATPRQAVALIPLPERPASRARVLGWSAHVSHASAAPAR